MPQYPLSLTGFLCPGGRSGLAKESCHPLFCLCNLGKEVMWGGVPMCVCPCVHVHAYASACACVSLSVPGCLCVCVPSHDHVCGSELPNTMAPGLGLEAPKQSRCSLYGVAPGCAGCFSSAERGAKLALFLHHARTQHLHDFLPLPCSKPCAPPGAVSKVACLVPAWNTHCSHD